jgi:hypothetical protein
MISSADFTRALPGTRLKRMAPLSQAGEGTPAG